MRSTEGDEFDTAAEALFDDVLAPLAAGRDRSLGFAVRPDAAVASYYEKPERASMHGADFDLPGDGSVDGFVTGVCGYWTSHGHAELAALEEPLRALAGSVERKDATEDGEVSPFIYPMF